MYISWNISNKSSKGYIFNEWNETWMKYKIVMNWTEKKTTTIWKILHHEIVKTTLKLIFSVLFLVTKAALYSLAILMLK